MSRKTAPGTLIHCEYCGEDYSATYKRCPFCGEKPGADVEFVPPPRPNRAEADDGYVFEGQDLFDEPVEEQRESRPARARGGKRLAQESAGPGVNWPRLITFLCSLVMIAAALVIVFAYIYPKIHDPNKTPAADNSPGVSASLPVSQPPTAPVPPSQPIEPTEPVEPSAPVEPSEPVEPSAPVEPSVPVETIGKRGTITGVSNGLRVRSGPDTTYEMVGSLRSGDSVNVVADAGGGWYQITYSGSGGNPVAGYIKSEYVILGSAATPAPTPTPTPAITSGGATITGASNGLRVRSGPGTSYEILGSLRNGDSINVVSDAGGGWYQITYSGSGGKPVTGYIMSEYISKS